MIQLCINTLNSDHMTKEEQALGYQEWKDGETKQCICNNVIFIL